jgi:hypothetical protein
MNVFEVIGTFTEILLSLLGLATVVYFAGQGFIAEKQRRDMAAEFEDASVRDGLAVDGMLKHNFIKKETR